MVRQVDKEEWLTIIARQQQLHSLFFNPEFLGVIKNAFGYQLHYYVAIQKQVPLFAAAIFSNGKNVVVPLAFTYSSIYLDQTISDRRRVDLLKSFISLLKKDFRKISFRFNAEMEDLRPFIWESFQVDLRYTYIKRIGGDVHDSVLRNVERAKSEDFCFKTATVEKESVQKNLDDFRNYGLSGFSYNQYQQLFEQLSLMGCLKSFNVYMGEELVCGNIVLLDEEKHQLYTLLINRTSHKNATSYLYIETIEWCAANGYQFIDYCGANDERISNFKSYFNPHLTPYYLLSYSPYGSFANNAKRKVKAIIKRIVG